MYSKISSEKSQSFCQGLSVLTYFSLAVQIYFGECVIIGLNLFATKPLAKPRLIYNNIQ